MKYFNNFIGEPVVIDKPFASVLLADFFYTHCSNCYLRNDMLIPCTGCSVVSRPIDFLIFYFYIFVKSALKIG